MSQVAQRTKWPAIIVFSWVSLCVSMPLLNERDLLIEKENASRVGGNLVLTELEEDANKKLMHLKEKEVAEAMKTGLFPPSMHFFKAKHLIDQSNVFSILQKMPKGSNSNLHSYGISPGVVLSELLQRLM